MLRFITLLCAVWLCSHTAFAQEEGNTQITGTVRGAVWKSITLKIDESYKNNVQHTFDARINEAGEFTFLLPISEPQFVALIYGPNAWVQMYVEPGKHIKLDTDAKNFERSIYFQGPEGENNRALHAYLQQYPEESKFKRKQYKQGTLYYEVPSAIHAKIFLLNTANFTAYMKTFKQNKLNTIDAYMRTFPDLSPLFIKQLQANVEYEWAFYMLTYGYASGNKDVGENFFDFVHEINLNDDDLLSNPTYRQFIRGWINYKFFARQEIKDAYVGQYEVIKEELYGKTQAFAQADILARGLKERELYTLLDAYNDFVTTTVYEEYATPAVNMFQKKNRYAIGSPAPSFSMEDIDGNLVSLHDFAGKVVYVDFWATWCGPCLSKISMTKSVQQRLPYNDVVFIHVSLEKTAERWRESVRFRNMSGIHLFAEGGIDSDIAKKFNVKAMPEYFIIDKNGNFAEKPARASISTLQNCLVKLL